MATAWVFLSTLRTTYRLDGPRFSSKYEIIDIVWLIYIDSIWREFGAWTYQFFLRTDADPVYQESDYEL
ncbi:hypothetical protein IQ260_23945 [Leptolyngbya cf. ectocarpi LEGE 11479]|uniref:Uncharacterized protein n=1 Tax=Leptolyngbya cf. ectocarpi LEGE 11479 TaxID=1828722 RepID=A0A928ZYC2_LEPEC|nr:hypothetical protein [Leptolyngbya cf. ectocarpi LEGE 11479]